MKFCNNIFLAALATHMTELALPNRSYHQHKAQYLRPLVRDIILYKWRQNHLDRQNMWYLDTPIRRKDYLRFAQSTPTIHLHTAQPLAVSRKQKDKKQNKQE